MTETNPFKMTKEQLNNEWLLLRKEYEDKLEDLTDDEKKILLLAIFYTERE